MADTRTIPNEAETRAQFVIASEARQSSALFEQSGLPRRFAPRNDGMSMANFAIPTQMIAPSLRAFAPWRELKRRLVSRQGAKARRSEVYRGTLTLLEVTG